MNILLIIPARCGSKGIVFKNIADLCGKSLIQYTIDVALKLKSNNLINNVIVSTDCEKIADISRKFLAMPVPTLGAILLGCASFYIGLNHIININKIT